ncbi:MAG: hypothetical protein ACYCPT_06390 [Acidimicrobiales bacterium]
MASAAAAFHSFGASTRRLLCLTTFARLGVAAIWWTTVNVGDGDNNYYRFYAPGVAGQRWLGTLRLD